MMNSHGKYHIDQITTKISKMTGIMARARHCLYIQTLKRIYNTMVYPYLTYCSIILSSIYPTGLKPLFTIQKKIIRIMTFPKFRDESKPLFLALDILNISELNLYLIALFMYSYFNNNLPEYFLNYFRLN